MAFEAEPNLFAILRENCAINGATNIVAFQRALGRANGLASFQRSAFNSGDNRHGDALVGHEAVKVKVECFDDIQPGSKPDFVKIDVQGHELAASPGWNALSRPARMFVSSSSFHRQRSGKQGRHPNYCWSSFTSVALNCTKHKAHT
jgi:FkbM family methyltransferase